jgi:hypothetical protein
MIWAGHVALVGEMKDAYEILVGNREWEKHSEDLGVDERIILKWMLGKQCWRVWIEFIWLRIETCGGLV